MSELANSPGSAERESYGGGQSSDRSYRGGREWDTEKDMSELSNSSRSSKSGSCVESWTPWGRVVPLLHPSPSLPPLLSLFLFPCTSPSLVLQVPLCLCCTTSPFPLSLCAPVLFPVPLFFHPLSLSCSPSLFLSFSICLSSYPNFFLIPLCLPLSPSQYPPPLHLAPCPYF